MIELLVLIAIATIGVIYTSSTGEAESSAMAEKTAKEALNEAEGQNGIGILGIDVVARKMRDLVGKSGGAAVTADTLAEYRGVVAEDDEDDADDFAPAAAASSHDDWDEDEEGDDWSKVGAAAAKSWDHDDWSSADDDDDDDDDDLMAAPLPPRAPSMPAPTPAQKPAMRTPAPQDMVAAASAAPRQPAPQPAIKDPKIPPVLDTSDAPIVEDFDPELDELQIGYCPGEAGNGRIGIAEDPLRPGSAAVTLGGRCVAVVLNGYGKVRAHHIDLVCQEEDDLAA